MKHTSIILKPDERGTLAWHPGPRLTASQNGSSPFGADAESALAEPMPPNAPFHWQADGAWDDVAA